MTSQNKPKGPPKKPGQNNPNGQQPKPKPDIRLFVGIVKAVNSGDSVTIIEMDDLQREGTPETQFTFHGLKAPQLGRRTPDAKTSDEPFAWQSREFLRNLIIGQPVIYRVQFTGDLGTPGTERKYGEMWDSKENDLRVLVVQNGYADVNFRPIKNLQGIELEPSWAQQKLETALEEAKRKKLGMWSGKKDAVRQVKYVELFKDPKTDFLNSADLFEFFKLNKDKGPLNAVVESVKTGSQLNILLTDTMEHFPLSLSGIRCPGFKIENNNTDDKRSEPEPYMREAKFFTEYYLLHRNVTVTLEAMDRLNLYGTVLLDGEVNIAYDLLKMGLAHFVEWSVPKSNQAVIERLKEEEKAAQDARKRIFRNYHPPLSAPEKPGKKVDKSKERSVITGKVVEIVNGGTITVRVTNPNKTVDRIIALSSIRPQRIFKVAEFVPSEKKEGLSADELNKREEEEKSKRAEIERDKRENAHGLEAKEFLRNLLIGQRVRCVFDYIRSIENRNQQDTSNALPKPYWSVYYNDNGKEKSVATELVKQGLAGIAAHPEGHPRSADYFEIVLSEKEAQAQHKGIHANVYKNTAGRVNDLTPPPMTKEELEEMGKRRRAGTTEKAVDNSKAASKRKNLTARCKHFLPHLKRAPKLDAIVEYVFSGSRYKLCIPSQSLVLLFNLQGCVIERPEREKVPENSVKPDISPFDRIFPPNNPANISLHFVRDHIFQRRVQVTITDLDTFGIFSGAMYVNGQDFSLTLLKTGHARFRPNRNLSEFQTYKKAEENARKDKVGLWATWNFEEEEKNKQQYQQVPQTQSEQKDFPVIITDFRSGTNFSYQIMNEQLSSLNELATYLQEEKFGSKYPPHVPAVGEIVVAQFSSDNLWYRAMVMADNRKGKEAPTEFDLRYIDYGNRETLKKDRIRKIPKEYIDLVSPQAYDGKLFGVKAPAVEKEFGRESAEGFRELVWGKTLSATEIFKEKESRKMKDAPVTTHLILRDKDDEDRTNINIEIIRMGLARVNKNLLESSTNPFMKVLAAAQEEAYTQRQGIWECGYYPDSDEERASQF